MEFTGRYEHALDAKGRLIIPKRFRQVLTKEEPKEFGFTITIGLDGCLSMYSPKGWSSFISYFSENPIQSKESRQVERWFYSNAQFSVLDKTGRIPIPNDLKEKANITDKVVLIGVNNRVEIWSPENWESIQESIQPNIDDLVMEVYSETARKSQSS